MLYGTPATLRRDARRNRTAIVEAAGAVLSGTGSAALMAEVARRAGIGQATLYRHFPDRYALTAAVIDHHLAALATCARDGAPLRPLVHEALRRQVTMRPLAELAHGLDPATRRRFEQRLAAVFAVPVRRALEGGTVRPDLTPADILLVFGMVHEVGAAAAGRLIEFTLDGLFRA